MGQTKTLHRIHRVSVSNCKPVTKRDLWRMKAGLTHSLVRYAWKIANVQSRDILLNDVINLDWAVILILNCFSVFKMLILVCFRICPLELTSNGTLNTFQPLSSRPLCIPAYFPLLKLFALSRFLSRGHVSSNRAMCFVCLEMTLQIEVCV